MLDAQFSKCGVARWARTHPTASYNHIDGVFHADLPATCDFDTCDLDTEVFLSVRNVVNTDPARVASGPDGNNVPAYPPASRNLYNYLGRVYRSGFRFKT